MEAEVERLIRLALAARENAYAPYSGFAVGAALQAASGRIYTGANVENAAFSPTNCAERSALFHAVSQGERAFVRIAIVGGPKGQAPESLCAPCGVCRQCLLEFCDPKQFECILAVSTEQYERRSLEELLPLGFGPSSLQKGI